MKRVASKTSGHSGNMRKSSIHAGFRVPPQVGGCGNKWEQARIRKFCAFALPPLFPLFPHAKNMGEQWKALRRKGCRMFPLFPQKTGLIHLLGNHERA